MTAITPHIIHYCWFGHDELPDTAKKALASWEKYAPDFEIRRCDESVFDVNCCEWTRKAYAAKKYAFVADYARFRMLNDFGGVYMDLGSELVKDITILVETCSPFSAIEELSCTANTGLIASVPPRNPVVASVLARYESMDFSDEAEFLSANTVNEMLTSELEKYGFVREDKYQKVGGWTLFPSCYFNPVYGFGGFHIKKDTYSVHHYSGSWVEPEFRVKKKIVDVLSPFLGRRPAQVIGRIAGEIKIKGVRDGVLQLALVARDVVARKWGNDDR